MYLIVVFVNPNPMRTADNYFLYAVFT